MIVPYMQRLTGFLHSKGIFCELHSAVTSTSRSNISAGWDAWAQLMNDSYKIYDDFGDKLLIAVSPGYTQCGKACLLPEEEIRKAARDYANRVCRPESQL